MFNSSLRRVARTCPSATLTPRPSPTTSSTTTASFSTHRHQRRHSSSKPPVPPNNGSPAIPAASVKQVGAPRSTDKRLGAESRLSKRKAARSEKTEQLKKQEEVRGNEWTLSMPSVPSTQHLNPKDVFVASFFSTHRPITISGPLPPETSIEDFDKVFQVRKKKAKNGPADVIYTLNSVVQSLDEHVQGQQHHDSAAETRADVIKQLTQHNNALNSAQHLDGQPQQVRAAGNVKLVLEEIQRRFRPFNTPPPPQPYSENDIQAETLDAANAEANENMQARQLEIDIQNQDEFTPSRTHTIVINSTQPSLKSGRFFTSHRAPVSNPTLSHTIREPMAPHTQGGRIRRGVYVDPDRARRNLKYLVISVKRQRKLKMKKHKYKKLMRKTRNLRRRQDRL